MSENVLKKSKTVMIKLSVLNIILIIGIILTKDTFGLFEHSFENSKPFFPALSENLLPAKIKITKRCFPSLKACREEFDRIYNQKTDWPSPTGQQIPAHASSRRPTRESGQAR